MKQKVQARLTASGQQALGQHNQVLQRLENLPPVTIRNYLSDLRQFIAWSEDGWCVRQEKRSFTPQAVDPTRLIRYWEYLRTSLDLKPSIVNRILMSRARYFAWVRKTQLIQADSTILIKFVPEGASPPCYLSDEGEEVLVVAVNAGGTFRDQTTITLLLHTGLYAQELCVLMRQQISPGKRQGMLRIFGKRKKCKVPLNTTGRSVLSQYLETFTPECQFLFSLEKTHRALMGRVLGYVVTKYATQIQVSWRV